jgi:putative intracellular protease/amidase
MNPSNQPKVLVIVGDATETVDTLYPFYRLIEAGYKPRGRRAGKAQVPDGAA